MPLSDKSYAPETLPLELSCARIKYLRPQLDSVRLPDANIGISHMSQIEAEKRTRFNDSIT